MLTTSQIAILLFFVLGRTFTGTAYSSVSIDNNIFNTISVKIISPMHFPNIFTNKYGGEFRINSNSSTIINGSISIAGGYSNPAIIKVTGIPNNEYFIKIIPDVTIKNISSYDEINININESNIEGYTFNRKLNSKGEDVFKIGGTLTLKSNQRTGNYTGNISISVNYK